MVTVIRQLAFELCVRMKYQQEVTTQSERQRISRFEVTRGLTEVKPQLFSSYEVARRPCSWIGCMMLQLSGVHNYIQFSTPPLMVRLFLIHKSSDSYVAQPKNLYYFWHVLNWTIIVCCVKVLWSRSHTARWSRETCLGDLSVHSNGHIYFIAWFS